MREVIRSVRSWLLRIFGRSDRWDRLAPEQQERVLSDLNRHRM